MTLPVRKRASGYCYVCGRDDVERREGKLSKELRFHYARTCGLPCVGGPITAEERTYHRGVHTLSHLCGERASA